VKAHAERVVKDIRRQTRRHFSAEDKIRIVLDGLRGEDSIAELCRKEGIAQSLYYTWSKEFMEAGKRRLAGDTARAATTSEVQDLRREARALKECVADLTLENRLLKKSMSADGGDPRAGIPHPKSSKSSRLSISHTCPPSGRWTSSASPAGRFTGGMTAIS
jgi:transposase